MTTEKYVTSNRAKSLFDDVAVEFDIAREVTRTASAFHDIESTESQPSRVSFTPDTTTLYDQAANVLRQNASQILGQGRQSLQQESKLYLERVSQYYARSSPNVGHVGNSDQSRVRAYDAVIDIDSIEIKSKDHVVE